MNHKSIPLLFFISIGMYASAGHVSPAEAIARIQGDVTVKTLGTNNMPVPMLTVNSSSGIPGIYVFNSESGFLILPADDCAAPLIGYSDKPLDPENMPPAMMDWLNCQAQVIIEASAAGAQYAPRRANEGGDREVIPFMLETKWDQDAPYNERCPEYTPNVRCVTGCTATALAQVMYYHKWPERGTGSYSYTDEIMGRTVKLSANFENSVYQWNAMPLERKSSYTVAERDAVSSLMIDVGIAIQSDYGTGDTNATGSTPMNAAIGAATYFGYEKSVQYLERAWKTPEEWEDMVYNELAAGRPVVTGGYNETNTAGHCFVCDGYGGDGYFHFNWGWSGYGDGLYLLDALTPGATGGIGGGDYIYSYNQNALFGLQPDHDGTSQMLPTYFIYGDLYVETAQYSYPAVISSSIANNYYNGFYNYSASKDKLNVKFGLDFINNSTGESYCFETAPIYGLSTYEGIASYSVTVDRDVMPTGDYTVYPIVREINSETSVIINAYPQNASSYAATVGKYHMTVHNSASTQSVIEILSYQMPTTLDPERAFDMEVELRSLYNSYDGELKLKYVGADGSFNELSRVSVNLDKDETTFIDFICSQTPGDGIYDFVITDTDDMVIYDGIRVEVGDTGIESVTNDSLDIVYSPENATVTVYATDGNPVYVYNMTGAVIRVSYDNVVNVSELEPGIYIIRCNNKVNRIAIK